MDLRIDTVTIAALARALDVAVLRQQVTASNIANAAVAGHAARRVGFGGEVELLRDAAGQPASVEIDAELALLSQNQLHYQVLVKALSRQLSLLSSAVSDGKR